MSSLRTRLKRPLGIPMTDEVAAGGRNSIWLRVIAGSAFVFLGALLPYLIGNDYYQSVAIQVFINIALAVSFQLLFGYARLVSFGQAGFLGLSAYLAAILIVHNIVPAVVAWICGVLVVIVIAAIVARLVVKLEPLLLAVTTLALGQILNLVVSTLGITGGQNGLILIPTQVFGLSLYASQYWTVAVGMFLVIGATVAIVRSSTGRLLVAVGDDPVAARALGVDSPRTMIFAFAVASGLTAIAGIMLLQARFVLAPDDADLDVAILILAMVAVGGIRSITGAIIGAIVLTLIPVVFASLANSETLIYGGVLLVVLVVSPGGIVGLWTSARRRFFRRDRGSVSVS